MVVPLGFALLHFVRELVTTAVASLFDAGWSGTRS